MPQKAVDYSIKESTLSETMKQKMVPLCDVCYARNKAENYFIRSFVLCNSLETYCDKGSVLSFVSPNEQ